MNMFSRVFYMQHMCVTCKIDDFILPYDKKYNILYLQTT